ncbi:MAG: endoribonuclease MazF [bacterium]
MVMTKKYVPQRGDLVWLNFNPQSGHEQSGRIPALVLSPIEYNEKVGLALLCPITSQVKGYPFEVLIPEGFPISGAILSDQIKNLDWKVREAAFIAKLPVKQVNEVLSKIAVLLS